MIHSSFKRQLINLDWFLGFIAGIPVIPLRFALGSSTASGETKALVFVACIIVGSVSVNLILRARKKYEHQK